ncbi:uncharacterized protein LOC128918092 [Rissa tridactyla]|uniref:uncharacterized protein LOC128918092 n=1 Tax=Rissa tridactyla TaxID=75485 RepID=UPI0023BA401F|nr:uncharacterized protein LOC128918092 [Rissa tridactyla]
MGFPQLHVLNMSGKSWAREPPVSPLSPSPSVPSSPAGRNRPPPTRAQPLSWPDPSAGEAVFQLRYGNVQPGASLGSPAAASIHPPPQPQGKPQPGHGVRGRNPRAFVQPPGHVPKGRHVPTLAFRGRGRGRERGWLRPLCHLTPLRSKSQNLEVSLPTGEAVKALEKWLALGEESWSLKCPDWKGKAHFSSIFNSSSFPSDPRELRLAPGCPSAAPSKAPLSPAAGTQHIPASARAEIPGKTTHNTNPARRRTHIAQLPSRSSGGTRHRVKWLNRVKRCCANWSVFKAEPWGGVRQPHGDALCKP